MLETRKNKSIWSMGAIKNNYLSDNINKKVFEIFWWF